MRRDRKGKSAVAGRVVVWAISGLSLGFAVAAGQLLTTWEAAAGDMRLRLRYALARNPAARGRVPLTLLAIDAQTQSRLGRFGAGHWLSRKPFFDQLVFFDRHYRPGVLAYDVVFQEDLGTSGATVESRVSEDSARIGKIVRDLDRVSRDGRQMLSHETIAEINRLSFEQGGDQLAHCLATIMGNNRFPILFPFYFRGGWIDPKPHAIPQWSRGPAHGDRTGSAAAPDDAVRYVLDMAIPADDIHFPEPANRQGYAFSPNARMPSRDFIDYVWLGPINARPDPDGVIRRLPMVLGFSYADASAGWPADAFVPSFAFAASLLQLGVSFPLKPGVVQVHFGKEIVVRPPGRPALRIPINANGELFLNYFARIQDFPALDFADVAPSPTIPAEQARKLAARFRPLLDGRVVLVGVACTGMDVGSCPLDTQTPLVLTHLTAIDNILAGRFLAPLNAAQSRALMVVLFLLFTGLCEVEKSPRLGVVAGLFSLLYLVVGYLNVHVNAVVLPVVWPLLYIGICAFGVVSYRFFAEEKAKRRIRGMFSRMVSAKVLAYLEEHPDRLGISGRNVEATVFTSDIAGFTSISEHLPPEKLIELLNAYLTPITDCILNHGGYLDKYIGDGIMAVWGAPYPDPEHARKTCQAALEHREIVRRLNARLQVEYGVTLNVRMGVNSGTVTAGNVGSARKFQYTVLGDTVNLAFRLEAANKEFGADIIIGEQTRALLGSEIVVRALGKIRVLGKSLSTTAYALEGRQESVGEAGLRVIRDYEAARACFTRREWAECRRRLDEILAREDDPPSAILRDRALRYQQHPPGPDWDGECVQGAKD
ncbi:MAG: adenylate/guanylate cyclase domain-containing protein [Verrucomicrobiota bacterium]|nr:adenylate/guanylate cyclase domain-containing protein [Verrucomicrobiota bacterium]